MKLFETLSLECFIGKAFCPLLLNSETCIVDSRPPGLSSLGQAQNFYVVHLMPCPSVDPKYFGLDQYFFDIHMQVSVTKFH